jgi:curved DNA-binding protein CbpA
MIFLTVISALLKAQTLYDILNVERSATLNEITSSYHEKIKQMEADNNDISNLPSITTLKEAYDVLSDNVKRYEYDLFLHVQDEKAQTESNTDSDRRRFLQQNALKFVVAIIILYFTFSNIVPSLVKYYRTIKLKREALSKIKISLNSSSKENEIEQSASPDSTDNPNSSSNRKHVAIRFDKYKWKPKYNKDNISSSNSLKVNPMNESVEMNEISNAENTKSKSKPPISSLKSKIVDKNIAVKSDKEDRSASSNSKHHSPAYLSKYVPCIESNSDIITNQNLDYAKCLDEDLRNFELDHLKLVSFDRKYIMLLISDSVAILESKE